MIAAARLGQRVASLGQLGEDVYGAFFRRVMQVSTSVHLWTRLLPALSGILLETCAVASPNSCTLGLATAPSVGAATDRSGHVH